MKKETVHSEVRFQDKFIAFVDILGFKSKVEKAEVSDEPRLLELLESCSELTQESHVRNLSIHGPMICPESRYNDRSLAYEVTQVSDSAIISSEVSPAGIINLVYHIFLAVLGLLNKGAMVRGYISRGNIFHQNNQFMGTGYNEVQSKEKSVRAFRLAQDESSTPFVEIDEIVIDYIRNETDHCVQEMFSKLSRTDASGVAVIYPFQAFTNVAVDSFMNSESGNDSLELVREIVSSHRKKLDLYTPKTDPKANQKAKYYRRILDEQLELCNIFEREFRLSKRPAVKVRHDDKFGTIWDC